MKRKADNRNSVLSAHLVSYKSKTKQRPLIKCNYVFQTPKLFNVDVSHFPCLKYINIDIS
jgi:hypothetical protein